VSNFIHIDQAELERELFKELNRLLNQSMDKSAKELTPIIQEIIKKSLLESEELKALSSGDLIGEFGIRSSTAAIVAQQIALNVSQTVEVKPMNVSLKTKRGGLSLKVQPNDLQNVLSIPNGSYTYHSRRYKKDVTINWLDWFLTKGDAIIVAKFHFEESGGAGRSGRGSMQKGSSWRVRPEYSGTLDNNAITRALQSEETKAEMIKSIENVIKKNLS
jgi:hypothetical protein|tara:strand:+ start:916 stop:1569 length:654 start_codon:yes stop_codon:yes gene_type:complete